jgi:hypothetical protein
MSAGSPQERVSGWKPIQGRKSEKRVFGSGCLRARDVNSARHGRTRNVSERPPFFGDYFDDAVSAAVQLPTPRKMVIVQTLKLALAG